MNGVGDHLLPGAGFAPQQDRGVPFRNLLDHFEDAQHRRGMADDVLETVILPEALPELVALHDQHVIGDNFWLWRADHGANVGWTENTCDTGLLVTGDDVTLYGLFVEHTQKHQTIWQGEGGRVYFYQSEMPYDPPSQDAWRSPTGDGFASYKIASNVTTHEAWGLVVYNVFFKSPVVAENAIETPDAPGIKLHHLLTFRLGGGKPGSGIRNVVNHRGGEVIQAQKAMVK